MRWQATQPILARFARTRRRAGAHYRAFVAEGVRQGRRPELQGGGLVRSAAGWAAVRALRRGREAYAADERILGGSDFVERIRQETESARPPRRQAVALPALIAAVGRAAGPRGAPPGRSGRRRSGAPRPAPRVRDHLLLEA
jgi:hypothetical protein